jgi:hypothetical protein
LTKVLWLSGSDHEELLLSLELPGVIQELLMSIGTF